MLVPYLVSLFMAVTYSFARTCDQHPLKLALKVLLRESLHPESLHGHMFSTRVWIVVSPSYFNLFPEQCKLMEF